MLAWASVMAAVVCLGWCLVVGVLIWTTPVAGSVVQITMDSEGTRTIEERIEEQSFSDTSGLGIVPLVIPVLLAGWALWAAWWRRITALAVATFVLLVFCVTAFSIGGAYVPAGLGLVGATLVGALSGRGDEGRRMR